jgi:hypothetical protein
VGEGERETGGGFRLGKWKGAARGTRARCGGGGTGGRREGEERGGRGGATYKREGGEEG